MVPSIDFLPTQIHSYIQKLFEHRTEFFNCMVQNDDDTNTDPATSFRDGDLEGLNCNRISKFAMAKSTKLPHNMMKQSSILKSKNGHSLESKLMVKKKIYGTCEQDISLHVSLKKSGTLPTSSSATLEGSEECIFKQMLLQHWMKRFSTKISNKLDVGQYRFLGRSTEPVKNKLIQCIDCAPVRNWLI